MNSNDSVGRRIGIITDASVNLMRAAWWAVAAYMGGLTVVGVVVDQSDDLGGSDIAFAVASLALGYFLTVQLLRSLAPGDGPLKGGFGSYFGLALLSGLGIIFGLVLLIIPGLVLFVRWAPAYGIALDEGRGVTESMSAAWERTRPHFWPIALALLVPVALNIGGGVLLVLAMNDQGTVSLPLSLLSNAIVTAGGASITAVGIAVHALLRDQHDAIAEIFA